MKQRSWMVIGIVLMLLVAGQWLGLSPFADAPQAPPTGREASAPANVPAPAPTQHSSSDADITLPPEALTTLRRIHSNAEHPYRQDGTIFHNREGHLPTQARGWYREYTVDTPGLNHRGARRIVTGGNPPREFYYTDDHYRSFTRFRPPPEAMQ